MPPGLKDPLWKFWSFWLIHGTYHPANSDGTSSQGVYMSNRTLVPHKLIDYGLTYTCDLLCICGLVTPINKS